MDTVGQCIDIHCTGLFNYPELNEMYEGLRTLLEDNILTEQALEFLNEK